MNHYTINGDKKSGWSLGIYEYVPWINDKSQETITFRMRLEFNTFDELMIKFKEFENENN